MDRDLLVVTEETDALDREEMLALMDRMERRLETLERLGPFGAGNSEPRFVYWVSGGVLQRGAPSNPVDFLP